MTEVKFENTAVRITSKNEHGNFVRFGSGVLVVFNGVKYVLTAWHCIKGLEFSEFNFEHQVGYKGDFTCIEVESLVEFNVDQDWALIKVVDSEELDRSSQNTPCAVNFYPDTLVKFPGYQKVVPNELRDCLGSVINKQSDAFKIQSDITFDQGGMDGKELAEGLSGSGVFIEQNDKRYLVGIISKVHTIRAINSDINCCSITCLANYANEPEVIDEVENIKKWAKGLEMRAAERDVEIWKGLNVIEFNHIDRKNRIIYPSEAEAIQNTSVQLKQYLAGVQKLEELTKRAPNAYSRFVNLVAQLQTEVEQDYTTTVTNSIEAKAVKLSLRQYLSSELNEIFPPETLVKIPLAHHQIIGWLIDCSLNFTKND